MRVVALAGLLGTALACSSGKTPPRADALPDVSADALPDVSADALPDVSADALPEVSAEALPDVAADAPPDVVGRDAGSVPDAAADVSGDRSQTSSDGATDADNTRCPWRLAGADGGVSQDPVTVSTPFAAPDDSLTFTPPAIPCAIFKITDHGAQGNGTTKNTTAFAQTIAAAVAAGGGVVDVPAGNWLTGPIHLASRIELHLEAGATLLFSQTFADYLPAVLTRWEGLDVMNWSPFIYARDCTDVALTGSGTLNGQGTAWSSWKLPSVQEDQRIYDFYVARLPLDPANLPSPPTSAVNPGLRPAFVEFNHCANVLVDGPSITGSPYWTLHPLYSQNVIIRNVRIDTTATMSNGDGIDPDSSTNVLIEQSSFATSDDCIAIKSGLNEDGIAVGKPSRNIVVRNITTTTGHGGVAIGSEVSGGVSNVYVTRSNLVGLGQPIRLKTLPGRGGTLANLWFADGLTLGWNVTALELTTKYTASTILPHDPSLLPTLAGITFRDVTGTGIGPVYTITGPLSGLRFDTVTLTGSAGTCTQAPSTALARTTLTGVASNATVLPCN